MAFPARADYGVVALVSASRRNIRCPADGPSWAVGTLSFGSAVGAADTHRNKDRAGRVGQNVQMTTVHRNIHCPAAAHSG